MVEVTILSNQSIKPPRPLCNFHPSIPLSLLDQFAPPTYVNILFFYPKYSPDTSEKLKSSLSQTLKYFYPLAGRIRDTGNGKLHVECNDEGVELVETRITGITLETICQGPAVELNNELLPIKRNIFDYKQNSPLLAVKVSALDDGGFALGVSVCHLIADGASLSMFLHWWSHTARRFPENYSPAPLIPPQFGFASVFPPREMTQNIWHESCSEDKRDIAARCFTIGSKSLEKLKQVSGKLPTRVEAVSALMCRCIQRAQGENMLSILHAVNLRKRLLPTLPHETSFGNLWFPLEITVPDADTESIEENIRRSVRGVDGQLVRMGVQKIWDEMEGKGRGQSDEGIEKSVQWAFSSWCRMGWYECDFGFEEPVWVAGGVTAPMNICLLIDAKDGEGMDVWLSMAIDEMERIANDHEFRRFVCSSQVRRTAR
jgi:shikimate O-hydroxycinnamoyltransferase